MWLPPHRRAPRSHRCRHRGRGRGTRGHRPRDTGRPHRTLDSGSWTSHARTLDVHPDTGHRTRGRDRVLGQGDLDTAGTGQTFRTTTTTRPPAGRRTVDLWTAPAALGNDDGSATMRYLPARDYLQHYQGLLSRSVGQAAPWRIALLGRLRVERRANGEASSVMTSAQTDAGWFGRRQRWSGSWAVDRFGLVLVWRSSPHG